MIDGFEQFLKFCPAVAFKIRDDWNGRLSSDTRGAQHSEHSEMVYEEDATCADQFRRRPVWVGSNGIARVRKNVPRRARLIDDDIRMHWPGVDLHEQMIEADAFFCHGIAGEEREIVIAEDAGISALGSKTGSSHECGRSQTAALTFGAQYMGLLVGRGIVVDVDQFVDGDSA